jgi:hypothetical protein
MTTLGQPGRPLPRLERYGGAEYAGAFGALRIDTLPALAIPLAAPTSALKAQVRAPSFKRGSLLSRSGPI